MYRMCAWPRDLLPTGSTASCSSFATASLACAAERDSCRGNESCVWSALRLGRRPFAPVYRLCGMACPLISDDRCPGGLGCNNTTLPSWCCTSMSVSGGEGGREVLHRDHGC